MARIQNHLWVIFQIRSPKKKHAAYDMDDIYRAHKSKNDFVGVFRNRSPQLFIINPEMVRRVLVTDFRHFHDNEASTMFDEESDFIFANNPFVLTGEEWKERRAELTPGLTMSRIKTVFPVTKKICQRMTDFIEKQTRAPPKDGIDVKDISLRFTTEVVTDCVLGLDAASFSDNPTPIMATIKKVFDASFRIIFFSVLMGLFPSILRFKKMRFIPKDLENYFVNLMQNAIDMRREQQKQQQAGQSDRIDFLNYMLQLQDKKHLSTKQLTAHTMTFLLDGFETTAITLSHCLLLLAREGAAQEKLRTEILQCINENDELDFEKLIELPYLDACIHETIRLFPPAFFSNKLCTEPIELANKDGRTLKVKKGEVITLPLYSIMTDEEYYPNPQKFQPERFLEDTDGIKKFREMGLYYGFGDGPRVCIGMRFALVQMRAAIATILKNFTLKVNPRTRTDNLLDPTYFLSRLDGGIWLDFQPIK